MEDFLLHPASSGLVSCASASIDVPSPPVPRDFLTASFQVYLIQMEDFLLHPASSGLVSCASASIDVPSPPVPRDFLTA